MRYNAMRWVGLVALTILTPVALRAQGRIVLHGGSVKISNGAVVVVANSNVDAITRTASGGYFISEGADNRIRWNIGTATGAYVIPWGTSAGTYIPLSFTPSGASGPGGFFYFATYQTAAQNSATLPAGIGNFNNAVGVDGSLTAADRFWRIQSQAYTTAPAMANMILSYADADFASPNKTTVESKLTARRWNPAQSTWQDYVTGGVVNTSANTVTIATLPAAQQYPWWSVQYPGAAYHWIASTSANYNAAANWSSTAGGTGGLGVPGPGDAVFFDDMRDGSTTINTAVDVGSLTVAAGYTGTISQGAHSINVDGDAVFSSGAFAGGTSAVSINGNLVVSGTNFTAPSGTLDVKKNVTIAGGSFAHNNGKISFSGTTGTQTLSAAAVTFYNIDVTNTSGSPGMILESNSMLAGVLTLGNNVVVDPDGVADNRVLTLLSTGDSPTKDAAVGILPTGASVNGRVTVQRYMTIEGVNGGRIYRYISSPVSNATVADIQNEIPVTGTFTGTSKCTGCNTAQSMFGYDESVITDLNKNGVANYDDGYFDFPKDANTEILQTGKGYTLFVRGNLMTTALWDVRGNINAGNNTPVTIPVSYTSSGVSANDGWNLVGNPYPSTIDWNAASGWTKTNINSAIYTRDNGVAGGQYATWNGVVGTNGGSRYIATGQAFWVRSNAAAPVLLANENVKAPGTQTVFFRESAPTDVLRITLSQGSSRDEAVIHLRPDATSGFDARADAAKLPNVGLLNLSTRADGLQYLAINSLDRSECLHTVSLSVDNVTAGSYNLSFAGLDSFDDGAVVTLKDAFTGASVDIGNTSSYVFNVTGDAASYGSARFSLTITRQPAPTDFTVSSPAICQDANGSVQLDKASRKSVYAVLMNDKVIATHAGQDGTLSMAIPAQKLKTGDNPVVVRATPAGVCGSPVSKTYTLVVMPRVTPQSTTATVICREGQATLSASGATDGQVYHWYAEADDERVLALGSTFTTPVLAKNATYYVGIENAAGCEGNRVPVVAKVVHYDDPQIEVAGDSLYTTAAGAKQWYLDGSLLSADTVASIKPRQSGVYALNVQIQTCVASAVMTYNMPKIVTGVSEATSPSLQVFPNPVRGYLYFESDDASARQVIVQNISGQTVGNLTLQQGSGKLDMSTLAAGMYLIKVQSQGVQKEIKVIKE